MIQQSFSCVSLFPAFQQLLTKKRAGLDTSYVFPVAVTYNSALASASAFANRSNSEKLNITFIFHSIIYPAVYPDRLGVNLRPTILLGLNH